MWLISKRESTSSFFSSFWGDTPTLRRSRAALPLSTVLTFYPPSSTLTPSRVSLIISPSNKLLALFLQNLQKLLRYLLRVVTIVAKGFFEARWEIVLTGLNESLLLKLRLLVGKRK